MGSIEIPGLKGHEVLALLTKMIESFEKIGIMDVNYPQISPTGGGILRMSFLLPHITHANINLIRNLFDGRVIISVFPESKYSLKVVLEGSKDAFTGFMKSPFWR